MTGINACRKGSCFTALCNGFRLNRFTVTCVKGYVGVTRGKAVPAAGDGNGRIAASEADGTLRVGVLIRNG